jgi:hypothetical protein
MTDETAFSQQHVVADQVIDLFGGLRPMASKLGIPVTTVQGWKKRGVIPANRLDHIRSVAADLGLTLDDILVYTQPSVVSALIQDDVPDQAAEWGPDGEERDNAENADLKEKGYIHVATSASTAAPSSTAPSVEVDAAGTSIRNMSFQKQEPHGSPRTSGRQSGIRALWWALAILSLAVLIGLATLGPGALRIREQDQKLETLQTELSQITQQLAALKNQNAVLTTLLPKDVAEKVGTLQARAKEIEQTVASLGTQTKALTEGVMGASAGTIQNRISVIEDGLKKLASQAGAPQLSKFLLQVQQWQASAEGAKMFGDLMTRFDAALASLPAHSKQTGEDLARAVKKDPVLSKNMGDLTPEELEAAGMLLTLTQLRQTLARDHASFDQDLAILRRFMRDDNPELLKAMDRLAPAAKQGVLTPDGLSVEFRKLAGDIVAASLSGEDVAVSARLSAKIHDILKIERNGQPVTGTRTQQAIDRAQQLLDGGDVSGAITELQALDGAAAQKAAPFVQSAENTLLSQNVLDALTRNMSAQLSLQPFMQQMSKMPEIPIDVRALTEGLARSLGAPAGTLPISPILPAR